MLRALAHRLRLARLGRDLLELRQAFCRATPSTKLQRYMPRPRDLLNSKGCCCVRDRGFDLELGCARFPGRRAARRRSGRSGRRLPDRNPRTQRDTLPLAQDRRPREPRLGSSRLLVCAARRGGYAPLVVVGEVERVMPTHIAQARESSAELIALLRALGRKVRFHDVWHHRSDDETTERLPRRRLADG